MTLPSDPAGVFNPATALAVFVAAGNNNKLSTLHLLEYEMQVLAALGLVAYFEGPGPNPMVLGGAANSKVWLRQGSGVQDTPGDFRVWNRVSPDTSESNWVSIDFDGFRRHLRLGRRMVSAQSAATSWTITHNFGAYPDVAVWSADMTERLFPSISQPSVNHVVITHASAIAGNVILQLTPDDAVGPMVAVEPPTYL